MQFCLQTIGNMVRAGQNRIYTPYMTVYLIESLPKMPYIHRIFMVLANPKYGDLCDTYAVEQTEIEHEPLPDGEASKVVDVGSGLSTDDWNEIDNKGVSE